MTLDKIEWWKRIHVANVDQSIEDPKLTLVVVVVLK